MDLWIGSVVFAALTANSTIQDGGSRHLEKSKNLNIFEPIDWFWRNLACWCATTLSTQIANKILQSQKSKIAAAADILKIWKIAICLLWIDQFQENLAWWCASILPTMSAYTSGSAMAEGPRDALVSWNSATTKHPIWKLEFQVYRVGLFAWSYV